MANYQPGDRVKVQGDQGRGEGTVIGVDEASGTYRVRYDVVEAKDGNGQSVTVEGQVGYAVPGRMTRRGK